MTLWIALVILCLIALGFVVLPMYRHSGRLNAGLAAMIVLIVAGSATLYHFVGHPGVPSGAGTLPDVNEMVKSLEQRMERTPDDASGWRMLGRSYQELRRYDDAIQAFERAISADSGQNAESLVGLAIVLLEQNGGDLTERAVGLFENALAVEPNNANALFYAGGAAAQRGDTALAADRWEMLLGLNAPPQIQELLQRKISEWRGLPPPEAAASAASVKASISVSSAAAASLPADATVFVIARDPEQPSPPIAVKPMQLSDLPASIELSDSDSMMPGRSLSGFGRVELVVRVSLTGGALPQSGDWFGSLIHEVGGGSVSEIMIDQQIP